MECMMQEEPVPHTVENRQGGPPAGGGSPFMEDGSLQESQGQSEAMRAVAIGRIFVVQEEIRWPWPHPDPLPAGYE